MRKNLPDLSGGEVNSDTDPFRRRFSFSFPRIERERAFVARLWATRRVGRLLEEMRLNERFRER